MNLHELIHFLKGKNHAEREALLESFGVAKSVRKHIHNCFPKG